MSRPLKLPCNPVRLVCLLFLCGAATRADTIYTPYTVTTLAGSAISGSTDGTGSAAKFGSLAGIAIDATENLYVCDSRTIRKITPAGVVTTFAGKADDSPGSVDGTGASAKFISPTGITADGNGQLYVADSSAQVIRKITSDAAVTTFAGLAQNGGSTDGVGSAARFGQPYGVATDSAGNIYVADQASVVRKITPGAQVTTLAGTGGQQGWFDGLGATARFRQPAGVAVDDSGTVYIADEGSQTVRKITSSGAVTTLAGTDGQYGTDDGPSSSATFARLKGIAVDRGGNVFVSDWDKHTIRRITAAGVVSTIAGRPGIYGDGTLVDHPADGIGSGAGFTLPHGVAVDFSGNVYVADNNHRIRKCAPPSGIPEITLQPLGQIVAPGATVNFVTGATGGPIPSFQWRKDGVDIVGATSRFLTLSNVNSSHAGAYTVVCTNFAGVTSSGAATLTVIASVPSGDLNGDGKSDIVLTNTSTTERAVWLMNGTVIGSGASLGLLSAGWQFSASGDFNGDSKADIVLTNTTTGERAIWLMNGMVISAGASLGVLGPQWSISGTGDFNGDGKSDILLTNNTTGDRAIWLMNGAAISAGASLGVLGTNWAFSGTGDFNADGKCDIILTDSTTGERAVWLMNGTSIAAGGSLGVLPTAWAFSGTGDFNADGKSDLLLSNTATGDRAIWLMNGTAISAGAGLGALSTNWTFSRVGDFNGDGKADIFLTNGSTGERAIWLMNGTAISAGASLGVVPTAWVILR